MQYLLKYRQRWRKHASFPSFLRNAPDSFACCGKHFTFPTCFFTVCSWPCVLISHNERVEKQCHSTRLQKFLILDFFHDILFKEFSLFCSLYFFFVLFRILIFTLLFIVRVCLCITLYLLYNMYVYVFFTFYNIFYITFNNKRNNKRYDTIRYDTK